MGNQNIAEYRLAKIKKLVKHKMSKCEISKNNPRLKIFQTDTHLYCESIYLVMKLSFSVPIKEAINQDDNLIADYLFWGLVENGKEESNYRLLTPADIL
ncbi:hypothetical protein [Priestia megaterium]|uniref:hypothetical protein n=1 Tax=Priestia megaterium TaxID=1404 RepID=UPI000BFA8A47|nr:hypothetical protein [Priestia megaterium]PFQ82048.1 hypothetical protein COK11_16340 [Priestia megaterium]